MKKKLGFLALAIVLLLGAVVVVHAQSNKCTLCNGTGLFGRVDCAMCSGTGTYFGAACSYCKGSGIYTASKCLGCNGTGIIGGTPSRSTPSNPGNSGGGATAAKDCPHCNASGICSTCNGKGWFRSAYATDVDCPNCYMVNGRRSGKCQWCKGTGKR